jgi:tetratricopeptide (TPR) repeat protein
MGTKPKSACILPNEYLRVAMKDIRIAPCGWDSRTTRILAALFLFFCAAIPALGQDPLPAEAQTQVAAGVQALKSGDLITAEKIFSEAEHQGLKHPLIFHNLGIIAQQRGNHEQAIIRFRQAIQLKPDYGPSHLLLGSSLLAVHRQAEALRELKRAANLMPDEPQAHLLLAKACEASNNWIGAVQEYQRLASMAPQEPEYAYQLGKALSKLSGWSYQEISRVNPNSARLQLALGQEYAIQEKYDQALAAYRRAAELDPKLPEIHLGMAVILLEQKKYDEALAEVRREQSLVPESKAAAETRAKIEADKLAAGDARPH